jgi:hypothetical protein
MKTLSISAVIVAGLLIAAGTGLMGHVGDETAGDAKQCFFSTLFGDQSVAASVCATEDQKILTSTEADGQNTACSAGSCCSVKPAQVLTSTDGEKKACGTGTCCPSKAQQVLTTTEADGEKKACEAGTCCPSKAQQVLTSTEADGEKKACAAGTCCASKGEKVLTSTEVASDQKCDGKDCKPTGECCQAKQQKVLTSTEADGEKKACAAGTCCASKGEKVLTSTEADGEKKACAAGTCCPSKGEKVLTSTEARDEKEVCDNGAECPSDCPVAVAMEKLPKMSFAVGEAKVCCGEKAQQLAEEQQAAIHYVVADKPYECKSAAMTALVEATEQMVAAFTEPKKCEASGLVSIGGKSTACAVDAENTANLVRTAADKVEMQYFVDGQQAACPVCAATSAKEKSLPIEYVVGDQKTTCQLTARLNLARAKYLAGVQAVASQAATVEAKVDGEVSQESGS